VIVMYDFGKELSRWMQYRVTRLGEFSPIGRFFTIGSFVKFTEKDLIFGLPF
jgi:hypothetical protein